MTNIKQVKREDLPEMEPLFEMVESTMGFVPNSMLTMAHWPALLQSFGQLGSTVLGSGELEPGFKQLIAYVSSHASGCRYCQAHTSHSAAARGIDTDRIQEVFEFESSNRFSDAEKAALRIALMGGIVPNGVEASHFEELSRFYSEKEIVEIVAVIALFGFLNRWNDTLATTLEDSPADFATEHLTDSGWEAGKHR